MSVDPTQTTDTQTMARPFENNLGAMLAGASLGCSFAGAASIFTDMDPRLWLGVGISTAILAVLVWTHARRHSTADTAGLN